MSTEGETILGVSSMATRQILADLARAYEDETGRRVSFQSMGGVEAARRVREGERYDVVVLAADALEKLEAEDHILSGSRAAFARSDMAMAIRAGAPHPPLQNELDVKNAVLAARTIGSSTGPSGAQVTKLIQQWGLEETLAPRLIVAPPGVPVAALIARGEAEIGFQQLSELLHEPGVEVVGALPSPIASTTVFSLGVGKRASDPTAAATLSRYLASAKATETIRRYGMEPA